MILHGTAGVAAASVDLGQDVGSVAILNKSTTATLYARADGTAAVVAATGAYTIPPGARRTIPVETNGSTVVSLIASAAATGYELEG